MQPSTLALSTGQGLVPALPFALPWCLPFAGLLASFALGPLLAPRSWHRWEAPIAGFWAVALLAPLAATIGPGAALAAAWRDMLGTTLPFLALLLALYAAGGGVLLRGGFRGTPAGNTAFLALGTLAAGVMGTTAAAMVLIHPLLAANAHRKRKFHLVLGFILLVANAGGALSPLGPPLYLGFLRGVGFFWPLRHLGPPLALLAGLVLAIVFLWDRHLARAEAPTPPRAPFRLRGGWNLALIALIAATVFLEGVWPGGRIAVAGATIPAAQFAGIGVCLGAAALSAGLTPRAVRRGNDFSWRPMAEVAWFFLALFVTLMPIGPMLAAGAAGPLGPAIALASGGDGRPGPGALFWLTGGLSALLDNAPSYLMAWGLAGIGPGGAGARALAALSAGAVFFGGLTYLGNAPNLVVRAIAAHRGVRMPGFLAYAALAALVLGPALVLLAVVWVG